MCYGCRYVSFFMFVLSHIDTLSWVIYCKRSYQVCQNLILKCNKQDDVICKSWRTGRISSDGDGVILIVKIFPLYVIYLSTIWRWVANLGTVWRWVANLGTMWKWVANFTTRPLVVQETNYGAPTYIESGWVTELVWRLLRKKSIVNLPIIASNSFIVSTL